MPHSQTGTFRQYLISDRPIIIASCIINFVIYGLIITFHRMRLVKV